jgi:hypothetical protein
MDGNSRSVAALLYLVRQLSSFVVVNNNYSKKLKKSKAIPATGRGGL